MIRITQAVPLEDFRLRLRFNTGEEGVFDMRSYLERPAFASLRDQNLFRHVMIDEIAGTICWPNGIDFCPDMVYKTAQRISQDGAIVQRSPFGGMT